MLTINLILSHYTLKSFQAVSLFVRKNFAWTRKVGGLAYWKEQELLELLVLKVKCDDKDEFQSFLSQGSHSYNM